MSPSIGIFPDLLEYEPCTATPSDTLTSTPSPSEEFKLRVERLARNYLKGKELYIHTASLRGPFDSNWGKSQIETAKRTLSSNANNSLSTSKPPGPATHPSTPRDLDTADRTLEWIKATAFRPRQSGYSRHITDQNTPITPRSDEPRGDRRFSNPSLQQGVHDVALSPDLVSASKQRPRNQSCQRELSARPPDKAHLPSPRSYEPPTEPHLHEEGTIDKQADHSATTRQKSSCPQNIPKPPINTRLPKKRAPQDHHCEFCGTQDTFRWVKGPAGPGTLCKSCGGRWAYRRLRAEKSRKRGSDKNSIKPFERPDSNSVKQCRNANETEKAGISSEIQRKPHDGNTLPVQSDDIPRSTSTLQLPSSLMPARRASRLQSEDIRRLVFSKDLLDAERVACREAINLRGNSSPYVLRWVNAEKSKPAPAVSNESGMVLSPRRHVTARLGRARRESLASDPARCKRRRLVNFDIFPSPSQASIVTRRSKNGAGGARDSDTATTKEARTSFGEGFRKEKKLIGDRDAHQEKSMPDVSYTSKDGFEQNCSANGKLTISAGDCVSSRRRCSARSRQSLLRQSLLPSTQNAMEQAFDDFQDGLQAPKENASGESTAGSPMDQHHSQDDCDVTPFQDLMSSRGALSGNSNGPEAISTQDLFAAAPLFNEASSRKKAQKQKKRASFALSPSMDAQHEQAHQDNSTGSQEERHGSILRERDSNIKPSETDAEVTGPDKQSGQAETSFSVETFIEQQVQPLLATAWDAGT